MFEDTLTCNYLDSIYLRFWYWVTEWNLNQPHDKHYFNTRKFWKKQQVCMTQCHGNIWVLTLSNPIFLPTAYSPALIHCGQERGWWITCNYPTVLKEKNINMNSPDDVIPYFRLHKIISLIFVVPCIMLNSEINPTRCNNCVYSSQWLMMGGIVTRNM